MALKKNPSLLFRRLSMYFKIGFAPGPRWGTIFITRKCNRSCSYCNVPSVRRRELDTHTWKKIIFKLHQFGVRHLTIIGGEPLLRNDLLELIRYSKKTGMAVFLHSNFDFITQKQLKKLSSAGLDAITGSVNELDNMGCCVISKLISAKDYKILAIASSVVTSNNCTRIPDIADYCINRGLLYNFGLYQNVGRDFSSPRNSMIPDMDLLSETVSKIVLMKKKRPALRTTTNFLRNINSYYYSKWRCDPNSDHWINIDSDGTLMRCQEFGGGPYFLSMPNLEDSRWDYYKRKVHNQCPGCFHHCYYDAETLSGWKLLNEATGSIPTMIAGALNLRG